jgi:uncharacterized protein YqeY
MEIHMLIDQLSEDMKAAMKAREKEKLGVVRMLLAELKNAAIANGGDLDEEAELKVVGSYAKKRKESIESAMEAGRTETADKERFEYEVTMSYLPAQLDEDALKEIVQRHVDALDVSGPQAFGQVMKAVMAEVGGQSDGKTVSAAVRAVLS